jgi:TPP-dependent pyruvate/acetoin dehydrogenase alpha subunit
LFSTTYTTGSFQFRGWPTSPCRKTYRFYGHFVGDPLVYRSKEEAEDWIQNRDPLQIFEAAVVEAGLLETDALRRIDGEVAAVLEGAVASAEEAPLPEVGDVLTDVYVEG